MGTLRVMDRTGDTRFDLTDEASIKAAEERFKELTGVGFTAAERTGPGDLKKVTAFNPDADTLLIPQYQGG